MESKKKEEKQIKVYVEKGSPLYKKLEGLSKKYPLSKQYLQEHPLQNSTKGTLKQFLESYKNSRLLVADKETMILGKIEIETTGDKEQIYIEVPEKDKDKPVNLVYFHEAAYNFLDVYNADTHSYSKYEFLGKYGNIEGLKNDAQQIVAKSCKISCRTAPGKEPSIRIQFPDGNKVTFYQDGWCNGKNNAEINVDRNMPIKTPGEYTIYKVGQGDDAVEISYRHTGNKSIRITNKNGDGICVYPDLYVNPVKNGKTQYGEEQINCNLFEFIENNFFRVGHDTNKSFLKKPLGNGMQNQFHSMIQPCQFPSSINNQFNNQHSNTIIQHASNSNTLYSLEEKNEFTINL